MKEDGLVLINIFGLRPYILLSNTFKILSSDSKSFDILRLGLGLTFIEWRHVNLK